jgi:nucleoside-diphosphate-sugar epimerase
MILSALRNKIEIWNDGKQTRSFLYIDDCVEAILRLMESSHLQPINIGSERLISMNDLAALVVKISGKNIKPKYCPEKPMGVRGRNSDNTLVRKVLNWEPQITLEDGMTKVYQWAEEHFDELEGI